MIAVAGGGRTPPVQQQHARLARLPRAPAVGHADDGRDADRRAGNHRSGMLVFPAGSDDDWRERERAHGRANGVACSYPAGLPDCRRDAMAVAAPNMHETAGAGEPGAEGPDGGNETGAGWVQRVERGTNRSRPEKHRWRRPGLHRRACVGFRIDEASAIVAADSTKFGYPGRCFDPRPARAMLLRGRERRREPQRAFSFPA